MLSLVGFVVFEYVYGGAICCAAVGRAYSDSDCFCQWHYQRCESAMTAVICRVVVMVAMGYQKFLVEFSK